MTTAPPSPQSAEVTDFLASVEHPGRREDALILDGLFRRVTGFEPTLWRGSMVGYGRYEYTYDSGHSGSSLATGFAPRKANMVVYIMPGYADFSAILDRLGKHKIGKACVYLGRLEGVDLNVLGELVQAGLDDLASRWTIHPS
jgi:hypothetical protein